MDLYPAIDLRGGHAVRLEQGDYARETVYDADPVAVAQRFEAAGARWIHVVDLDAARDGGDANLDVIVAICSAVRVSKVQTSGGVRDARAARARLDAGAARVVIGSAAIEEPALVAELAGEHPGAVALGLDVHGRTVRTHGWTSDTGLDIADALDRVLPPVGTGIGAIIATQIAVDGLLTGPDLALYEWLLAVTDIPIVASGGVASTDDLGALAALQAGGRTLAGAIVGRAIYEGRVSVEEGIAACSPVA